MTLAWLCLSAFVGTYQGGRGGTEFEAVVALAEGKLKLTGRGQTVTLAPFSKTEFRAVEQSSSTVEFKMDGGKVTGFVLDPGAQAYTRKP